MTQARQAPRPKSPSVLQLKNSLPYYPVPSLMTPLSFYTPAGQENCSIWPDFGQRPKYAKFWYRDVKVFSINLNHWEPLESDESNLRGAVQNGRRDSQESFLEERRSKTGRADRKAKYLSSTSPYLRGEPLAKDKERNLSLCVAELFSCGLIHACNDWPALQARTEKETMSINLCNVNVRRPKNCKSTPVDNPNGLDQYLLLETPIPLWTGNRSVPRWKDNLPSDSIPEDQFPSES
ncbi:hypothetical protein FQN60_016150 [Etheostoma spectabile]|uniref:Uncharacterized protein n=1 Tax=Etheostoma spectabile TaxID=54343 RepID=A0A5J5CXU1_9PERO|nr:hypothetical protein FQN60_016150 [Etheostoma spectabile]